MFSNVWNNPRWKQNIVLVHVMQSLIWHLWDHTCECLSSVSSKKLGEYNETPEWVQWMLLRRRHPKKGCVRKKLRAGEECWEYHMTALSCLKGSNSEDIARLFEDAWWKNEGQWHKLQIKRFQVAIRRQFFAIRVAKHWTRLLGDIVEIPFLAGIQNLSNQGSDLASNLLDQVTFRNPFQPTLSFDSEENNLFSSKTPSIDWGTVLIENDDIKEVQLDVRSICFKVMEVISSESYH